MPRFEWAPAAYRQLNGLLCLFKPADVSVQSMLSRIQFNLTRDLNELPCYKIEAEMKKADPTACFNSPLVLDSTLPVPVQDLLEHRLVLGQRYIPEDIKVKHIHGVRKHSSGVVLVGVGRGLGSLELLSLSRYLRVYHVKGRFGWATNDFSPRGKIIERTSYRHIRQERLDKVLASVQSSHQKNMFHYAGVNPHSQAAYQLAAEGLVRPEDNHTPPMIYSVKCVDFQLPDFTLEIHAINEQCDYLMNMIHDIGLDLKSTAVCTGIRRLRYGPFDVHHSLLRQQWTLSDVVDNLQLTTSILTPDALAGESTVREIGGSSSEGERKEIES